MRLLARLGRVFDGGGRAEAALGGHVETRSGPVHYLADGAPGGPPMVLLHDSGGNLRDWTLSIQPRLAREVPTLALDRPGFGHSRPARGPVWLLEAQTRALRGAVRSLGHRRYFLVGHGFSGALALDWALRYPDEVQGLCLIGGVGMECGGELSGRHRLIGLPVLGPAIARLAPLLATRRRIEAELAARFAPQEVPPGLAGMAGVDLALRPSTFRIDVRAMQELHAQIAANQPGYGRILCPVEVLHGAEDRIAPAHVHAEPLSRLLPDSVLTLLPGIGHMPHHVAPQEVLGALKRLAGRAGATRQLADGLPLG